MVDGDQPFIKYLIFTFLVVSDHQSIKDSQRFILREDTHNFFNNWLNPQNYTKKNLQRKKLTEKK